MTEPLNIFVVGLDARHCCDLEQIRNAERYRFHELLPTERVINQEDFDIHALVAEATAILEEFDGRIDGIIGHWDFPVTSLVPLLRRRFDLPGPDLAAVCKCTHKYWSRLEQQRAVPECTPAFQAIDPFADGVEDTIELDYPFWIKPVKGYASRLGCRVEDDRELARALEHIRDGIGAIGDAFNDLLELMPVPDEIRAIGGNHCLVEEIVAGRELAPEGAVHRGEVLIHGLIDMPRVRGSFDRYEYPAEVDDALARRIADATTRLIKHIGYDDACFNVEFFYDEERDKLHVIEINPRISQSHCYLFEQVDGVSNHDVAVRVASGEHPEVLEGGGPAAIAAKCMMRVRRDGIVRRVPSEDEIAEATRGHPGCRVHLAVGVGDHLSEMPENDAYSYLLAEIYACGEDRSELLAHRRAIEEALRAGIEIEEVA